MGIFEHSIFMPIIASLMFTVSLFSFLVVFHYSGKNFRLNHSPYLVLLEKNRQLVIKNIGKGSCHNLLTFTKFGLHLSIYDLDPYSFDSCPTRRAPPCWR